MLAATNPIRLDKLDLFSGCTRAQLQQISCLTSYLHLPKGHVLMHEGRPPRSSSSSSAARRRSRGRPPMAPSVARWDRATSRERWDCSPAPRTATVTATSDLVVLVSSVGEFRSILELAPSVATKVRQASSVRASDLELFAALSASGRDRHAVLPPPCCVTGGARRTVMIR